MGIGSLNLGKSGIGWTCPKSVCCIRPIMLFKGSDCYCNCCNHNLLWVLAFKENWTKSFCESFQSDLNFIEPVLKKKDLVHQIEPFWTTDTVDQSIENCTWVFTKGGKMGGSAWLVMSQNGWFLYWSGWCELFLVPIFHL